LGNTYRYDSFGNVTASSGSISNRFQYTAREFDTETGLYYSRARYYDPTTGHFLNQDPIGFFGGGNFYAYVSNDPVGFGDPTGLQSLCCIASHALTGAGIGGILGAIGGGAGGAVGGMLAVGAGGTLVAPGVGTVVGGGAGAVAGGIAGAIEGGAMGAAVGGVIGAIVGAIVCPESGKGREDDPCYIQYVDDVGWCGETFTNDLDYSACEAIAWENFLRCKANLSRINPDPTARKPR
jgi:RHS repeat-associated protein